MMRTFQRGDGGRSVKNSASNEIRAKTQFPVGSDRCEDYCKNQTWTFNIIIYMYSLSIDVKSSVLIRGTQIFNETV